MLKKLTIAVRFRLDVRHAATAHLTITRISHLIRRRGTPVMATDHPLGPHHSVQSLTRLLNQMVSVPTHQMVLARVTQGLILGATTVIGVPTPTHLEKASAFSSVID